MSHCDVVILGAGPYGLSAASHLRTIKGLDVHAFGEPMSFWEQNMPVGMFLRSNWSATQIADPHGSLTLEAYQDATGDHLPAGSGTSAKPVPIDSFVHYGQWFQRQAVPDLDRRKIFQIETGPKGFQLTLEDGEILHCSRVVVAAGISTFIRRPQEFKGLPCTLVSHSSKHRDFRAFAGKRVLVIGGGQSALESAALMHEEGIEVEVVARTTHINWLQGWTSKTLHHRLGLTIRGLLYAPTDVGPAGISQLVARPELLRLFPRSLQDKIRKRAVRPAGARWLVDRLKDVPIALGRAAVSAVTVGDKVKVRFSDGSEKTADHVLLGTGYRVDISKYQFLSPKLAESIQQIDGYPVLKPGLESSVPGLHFLGAPAVRSFGPILQFVSGARYASRVLMQSMNGKATN